jgi:hypothetical protein
MSRFTRDEARQITSPKLSALLLSSGETRTEVG